MGGTTPGGFKPITDIMRDTRRQITTMRKAVELISRATNDPLWAPFRAGGGAMGPALKNMRQTLEKAEGAAFRMASISSDADELFRGGKR